MSVRLIALLLVAVSVLAILAFSAPASAATLTVTNNANSGAGSLRATVAAAASGDTINFAPALSGQGVGLLSQIVIDKDLTIQGPMGRYTLDANDSRALLIGPDVEVSIADMNFRGVSMDNSEFGGAIRNSRGASLDLTRVRVFDSLSLIGGGLYNEGGSSPGKVSIEFSEFDHNRGYIEGGAIADAGGLTGADLGGIITIKDSSFRDNDGGALGGALLVYGGAGSAGGGGSVTVTNTVIERNSAVTAGGAIAVLGSGAITLTSRATVIVTGSTIDSNESLGRGGAVFLDGGPTNGGGVAEVEESTVSRNRAGDTGGGAYVDGSASLTIRTSTLSRNESGQGAGAVDATWSGNPSASTVIIEHSTITESKSLNAAIENAQGGPGLIHLLNTIVADQITGDDCDAPIASLNYNLDSDGTCNLTQPGDVPGGNANLGPLQLNSPGTTETHAIGATSDAFDKIPGGVNGCGIIYTSDQRGVARPQGQRCDIGAYEFECAEPCPVGPVGGLVDVLVGRSDSPHGGRVYAVLPAIVLVLGVLALIRRSRATR